MRTLVKVRTFLVIIVVVGLFLAKTPSTDALITTVTLADTNVEFSRGGFARTALGALNPGGVQLLPATTVRTWTTNPNPLPIPLGGAASISFGKQVFVIGGRTIIDGSEPPTLSNPTTSFFSAVLSDPATGLLSSWTNYATQNKQLPINLTKTSLAIATTSQGTFLYAIGGYTVVGSSDLVSSNSILYTRLVDDNQDGVFDPSGWQQIAGSVINNLPLPFPKGNIGGGAAEIGVVVETINNQPTLYLFGGVNRTADSSFVYENKFFDSVYRTNINPDGTLSGWNATPNDTIKSVNNSIIERVGNDERSIGLAGTNAITYRSIETGQVGVYLIGGRFSQNTTSSNGYVARFNNDGTLAWQNTASLGASLVFHSSVSANGAIFALGGSANPDEAEPTPSKSILAALLSDDLSILNPGGGLNSFTTIGGGLDKYRQTQTSTTIGTPVNGTWVYAISGSSAITTTDEPVIANADVIVGRFGFAGDVITPTYVVNGNYYSQVFDYGSSTTDYKRLSWKTLLPTGAGIEMGYRVGNNAATDFTPERPFIGIPVATVNGTVSFDFPAETKGRYFQFVARLSSPQGASSLSPLLDVVTLTLDRAGYANVKASTFAMPESVRSGQVNAPTLVLSNQAFDASTPALDAAFGNGASGFFVDVYIRAPSDPNPPVFGQQGQAYAIVQRSALPAGGSFGVPSGAWLPSNCTNPNNPGTPSCPVPSVNWNTLLPVGQHKLYVMVDSTDNLASFPFGLVTENDVPATRGEGDNLVGPILVTVTEGATSSGKVYLPFVRK